MDRKGCLHVFVLRLLCPHLVGRLLKDRLGDQRGGSEWEPIKILHGG
jgi:hypothetical protein